MKKREKEKGENWIKTRVKHILCSLGEKLNSGGIRKYNVFALSCFLGNLNKSLWEEKIIHHFISNNSVSIAYLTPLL